MYADVELLVIEWLPTVLTGLRTCTDLPAGLQAVLPVAQVVRFGGGDQHVALDQANVAVDTYAGTRATASDWAERIRQALLYQLPGTRLGATTFVRVGTIGAPAATPYGNPAVHRFGASYQLVAQTHAATVAP